MMVSVLVAAYNTEAYIGRCLDSLVAQTLPDVEILVVDDHSTDHTLAVARRYAERYKNVICLSLPRNMGQACARNVALARARGEYICFLDSDDWYSPDALERAVDVFLRHEETDCVLFRVKICGEDGAMRDAVSRPFTVMTGKEAFEASLTWAIHGIYMVRAAIHRRCPYDEAAHSYSDDNTTRLHYYHSRQVRTCEGVYHYLQRADSVCHRVSIRHFDAMRANESMLAQLRALGVEDRLLSVYENVRWQVVVDCYKFYFLHRRRLPALERRQALAEMRRVWSGIDTRRLFPRYRYKLGYLPLHGFWLLFRLEEEVYFTLKSLAGRM